MTTLLCDESPISPAAQGQDVHASVPPTALWSRGAWLRGLQVLINRAYQMKVLAARQRSRRALGELDDRLLADVGLTREQALQEAAKGFWED